MKKGEGFLLVSLAFILIFLSTHVSALTTISSCTNLSTPFETYELNQSITTTSTCINITTSNITLDCRGYNITYGSAGASSAYGINVSVPSGLTNITVKNCTIRDGNTGGNTGIGIYLAYVTHSVFYNLTILTSGTYGNHGIHMQYECHYNTINSSNISTRGTDISNYGIALSTSNYNTISNNNISTIATSSSNGISLSTSIGNTILNNRIFVASGSSNSESGLTISSASGNVVNNTTIFTPSCTSSCTGVSLTSSFQNSLNNLNVTVTASSGGSSTGMSFSNSYENTVTNANISITGAGSGNSANRGVYISNAASYSNSLSNFNIRVNGTNDIYGAQLSSSGPSNSFYNFTTVSNGTYSIYGFYFFNSGSNNIVYNFSTSTNSSGPSFTLPTGAGTYVRSTANSRFFDGKITAINGTGILFSQTSGNYPSNTTFVNLTLNSTINKFVNLSVSGGIGTGQTLINVSYSNNNLSGEFVDGSNQLFRKWYVDANISNQARILLNNSNFSISNSSGVLFTENTSSGHSRAIISDYINIGGTRTFLAQNLMINVSKENHAANSTSFNLSSTLNNLLSLLLTDLTPPNFTNILFNPNSSNSLDPGINLSFNVSVNVKYGNASNVILQYYNGSSWFNASMQRVGETSIYNTTILLANIDTNYTFNILANDSWSNTNISDNQTFNSSWDCGFNLMPSSLGSFGGFDEVSAIGNVTIQNYGDGNYSGGCSLDLRMSHSLSAGKIRFDGSSLATRDYYSILAGTNQTINLSALFEDEITDESFRITATDLASVSQNSNYNSTGTLVSSSGQPYLKITNEGQDSYNIYLTNNTLELKTYLQNIPADGTENTTAYNVTYNWSLPSGLLLESGTGNLSFVNISNSSILNNYINLTFNLTNLPSLEPTTLILNVSAIGYNYSGGIVVHSNNLTTISKQINITLSCYNDSDGIEVAACGSLDQDNPVVTNTITITTGSSSGGGGGGGGGGGSQFEKSSASYELVRGKQQEFNFEVKNKYSTPKKKMNISVKGLNSNYIDISPKYIEYLAPLSSKNISVRINAPSYFSASNYTLEFTISGQLDNNASTAFIETSSVTLFIVELSREDVLKLLNETRAHLDEMNRSGFRTIEVGAYLAEAEKNLAQHDFSGVKTETEHANKIYFAAIKSKQLLEELRSDIENAEFNGISVVDAKRLLFTSETIFERGDYLTALARLEEAKSIYALETKGEYNLVYDIKNNPTKFLFIVLGFGLFSFGTGLTLRYHYYKNKLKMLDEEERLLLQLIGTIQKECFQNNKMSMEEYQSAMSQYEDKLSETIEERVSVQTKLDNMLKMKGKQKALVQEKERLTQLMKELQNNYLNKGKLETRVYEKMLKAYSTRLTKVDEQLVYLEAANYIGKVGKAKL